MYRCVQVYRQREPPCISSVFPMGSHCQRDGTISLPTHAKRHYDMGGIGATE
jgi:hypothetical protein